MVNQLSLKDTFFTKIELNDVERSILKKSLAKKDPESVRRLLEPLTKKIKSDFRAIIIALNSNDDFFTHDEIHILNPIIASTLGNALVQNENGDTVISVYDRDRLGSMWNGARYHQTREGGALHTDNVNVPEIWDFLYLSCLSPALVGGETILVDGLLILDLLKTNFPDALATLEKNFVWEMRGVSDELYRAPIITYNEKGEPLYRHLRPYMESAHVKADQPLTSEQLYAIDVLDALTNTSANHIRYRMNAGDILLTKDTQVFHGRTCFSDALETITYDEINNNPKGLPLKRTMERLWINE